MIDTPLPVRSIFSEGTKYSICGLIHGNPWIRINPSFKKIVAQKLKEKSVLCEDGFVSWIPHTASMGEVEYFEFGKMSFLNRIHFLFNLTYNCFFPKNRENENIIFDKIKKMSSLEDLIEIKNSLFKDYLEEPFGMNRLMANKNSGTIDNPKGNIPLLVRRYIYEAKTSLNYVKENNLNNLYIVVGCAHELPLEYLLKNKKILEKYSL